MRCPHDETTLQMTERHGIEIDYCPTCRGVWLDRGELDKIIAQANAGAGGASRGYPPQQSPGYPPQAPPPSYPPQGPGAYPPPPGTAYPPSGYQRYGSPGSPGSPDSPRYFDPRYGDKRHRKRKRGGFLDDLFDF